MLSRKLALTSTCCAIITNLTPDDGYLMMPPRNSIPALPDSEVLASWQADTVRAVAASSPVSSESPAAIPSDGKIAQGSNDRGNFFAVDQRVWDHVCLMDLNAAVSFLVLARGSQGDNATTAWSVDAIERYTGISRHRAQEAIERLRRAGFFEQLRAGSKPLRRIRPAAMIPACEGYRGELTEGEQDLFELLPITPSPAWPEGYEYLADSDYEDLSTAEWDVVQRAEAEWLQSEQHRSLVPLMLKGFAEWRIHNGDWAVLKKEIPQFEEEREWIWLPNALIDGAAEEIAPVELLRQANDLCSLYWLVTFYRTSSLIRHGGLDPELFSEPWDIVSSEGAGAWKIWSFRNKGGLYLNKVHPLWQRIMHVPPARSADERYSRREQIFQASVQLMDLGLIEAVPVVYEADTWEAEQILPVALPSQTTATEVEVAAGASARSAAARLRPEKVFIQSADRMTIALPQHYREPDLRGIFRLRYRPHTRATAQWMSRSDQWERWTQKLDAVAPA